MPDDTKMSVKFGDNPEIEVTTEQLKKVAANFRAGGIAGDHLRSYIERIERLNGEKKGLGFDIAAVFAEAKASGFDPKVMREVIKRRAIDPSKLDEFEALLDVYQHALDV